MARVRARSNVPHVLGALTSKAYMFLAVNLPQARLIELSLSILICISMEWGWMRLDRGLEDACTASP